MSLLQQSGSEGNVKVVYLNLCTEAMNVMWEGDIVYTALGPAAPSALYVY